MKDRKRVQKLKEDRKKSEEGREQEKAAVKIQALGRKKRDQKAVEQLKSNNQVPPPSFSRCLLPAQPPLNGSHSFCREPRAHNGRRTSTCHDTLTLGARRRSG